MGSSRNILIEGGTDGATLEDVEEGQSSTGHIHDDKGGDGSPFEYRLITCDCQVEQSNGCFRRH